MHGMLAGFTGVAEMEIDEGESKIMASAVAGVAAHYNVSADPKTVAWVNLASALGMIYGPRIAAVRLRKKTDRPVKVEPKKTDAPTSVVDGKFPMVVGNAPVPNFDLSAAH